MFLAPQDLNTHVYTEVMSAISNGDDLQVETAISAAIGEAKGYMSRYNTSDIFAKEGTERDPILLMYIKDIAIWHFIAVANPGMTIEFRQDRYNDAIAWLTKVQAGKVVPDGWPLREPEDRQSYFQWGSNPRRQSHY